jgi:hypothetical protein
MANATTAVAKVSFIPQPPKTAAVAAVMANAQSATALAAAKYHLFPDHF